MPADNERNIVFGPNAKSADVSEWSLSVLRDLMRTADVARLTITSTQRSPQDQARVMFDNIERDGVARQKALYKPAGQSVIDAYAAAKAAGKSAADIKAAMVARIMEIGPEKVSRHAADPKVLNVFDISPASVANQAEFVDAARNDGRVAKVLTPAENDPAFHLEIPQPPA
ncbi:MAG TPA: hypothetical protein VJ276_23410 [Thermoanaerobaculia bacterium]|nr:hypothetical protein [Thermoanaerobaculia bacterium]